MRHSIAPRFFLCCPGNFMTLADCSLSAFVVLNTARLLGYIPQIMRVHDDETGGEAALVSTWFLFAAALQPLVTHWL